MIRKLKIDSSGVKKKYLLNESLDTEGLKVVYGSEELDDLECDYSYNFSTPGVCKVTVTYMYAEGSYEVTVV